MTQTRQTVVYFDGVCNLCNHAVDFIIRHDPAATIHFASLQSARGQAALTQLGLPTEPLKTIIVEVDGEFYIKSDAALTIASLLRGPVRTLAWFKPLPRWLRDPIYMLISNNRYRWFGKKSSCRLPTKEEIQRFID